MFLLDASDLLGGDVIDGGADTDTVIFDNGSFGETDITSILSDVEVLDFSSAAAAATLTLSSSEIQNMTDGSNALEIRIDSGTDSVTVSDTPAHVDVDTSTPGTTVYTIYDGADHGTATQLAQLSVVAVA